MDRTREQHEPEPNFSFAAPTDVVTRPTYMPMVAPSSSRPSTLQFDGPRGHHALLLTPNDYSKLLLSTPELDARARGYTTPDLINALAAQCNTDGQSSPSEFDRIEHCLYDVCLVF